MSRSKILFAVFAAFSACPFSRCHSAPVVYGSEEREDYYKAVQDRPDLIPLFRATAALFDTDDVVMRSDHSAILEFYPFTEVSSQDANFPYGSLRLSRQEKFYGQSQGSAFGSGVLVGPNLLLTAGHCIRDAQACAHTKFIFGLNLSSPKENLNHVPKNNLYSCAVLLEHIEESRQTNELAIERFRIGRGSYGQSFKLEDPELYWARINQKVWISANPYLSDWSLVRLDRKVRGREPVTIEDSREVKKGVPIFAIGYSVGLAAKISGGAQILAVHSGFFESNLSVNRGFSGAPVFDARTNRLIGIVSREPSNDFVPKVIQEATDRGRLRPPAAFLNADPIHPDFQSVRLDWSKVFNELTHNNPKNTRYVSLVLPKNNPPATVCITKSEVFEGPVFSAKNQ